MSGERVYVGVELGGRFHQVQVTSESGERLGKSFRIGRGRQGLEELESGVERVAGAETQTLNGGGFDLGESDME